MDELDMNPAQVSKAAGFAPTFIRDLLDGRKKSIRADALEKLAEVLQVTPAWLHGDGPMTVSAGSLPDAAVEDFQPVPIYDIRASAGAGALVEDGTPSGWQPYRASELTRWNIDDLAVIQVGGDSMWETLHDGDKVLVNRGEKRIVKPGIYILAYEGELLVKRCQRNLNDGSVMVSSDNPAYQSFIVNDPDKLNVLGRVVWIGRALG
jgi:phage repressor protein C with HTH and peptisase S24 domain